jgi:hypothetical protein
VDIVGFKDCFGSAVFRDVDHGAGQLLGCGQAKGYRIPDLGALACAVSTETAASPRLRVAENHQLRLEITGEAPFGESHWFPRRPHHTEKGRLE